MNVIYSYYKISLLHNLFSLIQQNSNARTLNDQLIILPDNLNSNKPIAERERDVVRKTISEIW